MNRGEAIVLDEPLGDQDRVLEVVAAPRHEGDEHVAPERQLALVGARPVGDDVALLDPLALAHDGLWLMQVFWFERRYFVRLKMSSGRSWTGSAFFSTGLGAHHDAVGRDVLDHPRALGDDDGARVARHHVLHPGADQRRLRLSSGTACAACSSP